MAGKEENDFRRNIHNLCEEIVKVRQDEDFYQRMKEVYPPILASDVSRAILDIRTVRVNVYLLRPQSSHHIDHTISVDLDVTLIEVRKSFSILPQ